MATETMLSHRENAPLPFRPVSRSKTTYGSMTSWAKKDTPDYVPPPQSARGDNYHDRYMQLSANVAIKHPNPGKPRERMGRIGGTWRHIREVLGYTGSQVCFVDGLVSLYDLEDKQLNRGPNWRARMAGPTGYSSNLSGHELRGTLSGGPGADGERSARDTHKYKGFYTLREWSAPSPTRLESLPSTDWIERNWTKEVMKRRLNIVIPNQIERKPEQHKYVLKWGWWKE